MSVACVILVVFLFWVVVVAAAKAKREGGASRGAAKKKHKTDGKFLRLSAARPLLVILLPHSYVAGTGSDDDAATAAVTKESEAMEALKREVEALGRELQKERKEKEATKAMEEAARKMLEKRLEKVQKEKEEERKEKEKAQKEREKERKEKQEERKGKEKAQKEREKGIEVLQRKLDKERKERVKERKEREKAEELLFLNRLDNEAATAPSASHLSASSRQGMAPAEHLEVSLPTVVGADVLSGGVTSPERAAWHKVGEGIGAMARAGRFPSDRTSNFEVKVVRAVMAMVLTVIVDAAPTRLWRYWRDVMVPDDVPLVQAKPDHCLTHARDAQVSLLGAHLIVEDKCPGDDKAARIQALQYGRRRVQKLLHLARDTGVEAPGLAKVSTLVVATDVLSVRFMRVKSGWPADGKSFTSAKPFPSVETKSLQLLPGFTGLGRTGFSTRGLPKEPTRGFLALFRLLQLCGRRYDAVFVSGSPGASVLATLTATFDGVAVTLPLDARLGVGGISDVYSVAGGGGVVKYPRHTSVVVGRQFQNEFDVLNAIGSLQGATVPSGAQLGAVPRTGLNASVGWPVLRMEGPVGESLVLAVTRCADEKERVDLANMVVGAVLDTLRVVHAEGIVHCDVRPANIVLADGIAYLVDWGASRKCGEKAAHHGVPAYAAPGVFTEADYRAGAAMDVCGALCTWIAIVHGGAAVEVPWIVAATPEAADAARTEWLRDNSRLVGVAAVRDALDNAKVFYKLPRSMRS